MKILLISNYLPDRQESMLRYANLLAHEMRGRGHEALVVHPPSILLKWLEPRLSGAKRLGSLTKWIGYIDKYLLAPAHLRAHCREADIVHVCDHSNSMYLGAAGDKPSLITCHDLLAVFAAQGRFSGQSTGWTGRLLQRWIASGLLRARTVVCVSHKTEHDLLGLAGATPPRTSVVHNPLNWDFRPVVPGSGRKVLQGRGFAGAENYLLHIGNNSWYKNRQAAVRIFAELKQSPLFAKTQLILAGKPWDQPLRAVIRASGFAADIIELQSVSNEELRALYSDAAALLFPSREEGFGWPILEAQACGCPVITTDRAPMTEVAGDAALRIDPADPAAAARTILAQWNSLPKLREQGFRNIERFSMTKTMDAYETLYRQVMAQPSVMSSV